MKPFRVAKVAAVLVGLFIGCIVLTVLWVNKDAVSRGDFERIKPGMTVDQVVSAMGKPGKWNQPNLLRYEGRAMHLFDITFDSDMKVMQTFDHD